MGNKFTNKEPIIIGVSIFGEKKNRRAFRPLQFAESPRKIFNRRKKDPSIRFFDLGWRWVGDEETGSYREIPFDVRLETQYTNTFMDYDLYSNLLEHRALEAVVLQIPVEQFRDNYYEIDQRQSGNEEQSFTTAVYKEGNDITQLEWNDDEIYTYESGLKLKRSQLTDFRLNNSLQTLFPYVDFQIHKITEQYDYDAPAIDFQLNIKADIFIMPQLQILTSGWSDGNQFYVESEYYFSSRRVIWRDVYKHPEDFPVYPDTTGMTSSDASYAIQDWLLTVSKQLSINDQAHARHGQVSQGGALEIPTWEEIPVTDYTAFNLVSSNSLNYSPFKALLAIINQKGNWYYVWENRINGN